MLKHPKSGSRLFQVPDQTLLVLLQTLLMLSPGTKNSVFSLSRTCKSAACLARADPSSTSGTRSCSLPARKQLYSSTYQEIKNCSARRQHPRLRRRSSKERSGPEKLHMTKLPLQPRFSPQNPQNEVSNISFVCGQGSLGHAPM